MALTMGGLALSFLVSLMIDPIKGLSINQPKLSPSARWNLNATTFADISTIGLTSNVIFINKNNNIYLAESSLNQTQIWTYGNGTPSKTITNGLGFLQSIFVTSNGTIYIDQGRDKGQVEEWTPNGTSGTNVMNVSNVCYGLFVDNNNTLYCSIGREHRVIKISHTKKNSAPVLAAGNGTSGNAAHMLANPHGIFVNSNFDLYVAECNNGRITRFPRGQSTGTSIAGAGAPGTITLSCPTDVNFDADGYLFIAEFFGHRIIRSGSNGFRCLLGCSGGPGNSSSQFNYPYSFSFDTFGNIFVLDQTNSRVQMFTLSANSYEPSYNQPKFCASATWYPNATTFANSSIVGVNPYGLFVNVYDTIYVAGKSASNVMVWLNGSMMPTKNLTGTMTSPYGLFATITGDLYVDNGYAYGRVEVWTKNLTNRTTALYVNGSCHGLFVDINSNLYCSLGNYQKVIKKLFNESASMFAVVAGNGSNASASNTLSSPRAIFVDTRANLYVADFGNHRIQLFPPGQRNGTTKAGNGAPGTIALSWPSGVVLDGNQYLFIADTNNHRIVGEGPTGFRCIVGCANNSGFASNQLNSPWTLAFDSVGNLLVADAYNNRTQKFFLASNSCDAQTTAFAVTSMTSVHIGVTTQSTTTSTKTTTTSTGSTTTSTQSTTTSTQSTTTSTKTTTTSTRSTTTSTQSTTTSTQSTTTSTKTTTTSTGSTTTSTQSTTTSTQTTNTTSTRSNTNITQLTTKNLVTTADQSTAQFTQDHSSASTPMVPTSTSQTPMANQTCFAPVITLIPSTSSLSSPIQFRRSQDFYISSTIQLNCNHSVSTTTQWTINNCTASNCSVPVQVGQAVMTTFSELYIPGRTLPYGVYELKLTVTMSASPHLIASSSAYARITPSGITANLVEYGTSMITRGHAQDLTLDPGSFSVDLDGYAFNATDWKYQYYCRIYGLYNFPNVLGFLLPIDDSRVDPVNPSCMGNLSGNRTSWQYNGVGASVKSSVTVRNGSLQSNRTYQFMVYLENRRNSSQQATGYLLVKVDQSYPQMVVIACVISTMCIPNLEFQLVNPTTQVALFSACQGSCSSFQYTKWRIYQGSNGSLSTMQWLPFNQTKQYENSWFFGTTTNNFTASNKLFVNNPHVIYWKFEVMYSFLSENSSSALNFVINQPPQNGTCSVSPANGTTSTLFTIACRHWFDQDEVKDYSLYSYTTDRTKPLITAFSSLPDFDVRLPAGDDNTSSLSLFILIRDTLDCVTEFNISSVTVTLDSSGIADLMNTFQNASQSLTVNPLVRLLAGGNQNTVGQILTSTAQEFNKINRQSLDTASSNGVPAASVSVASLGSQSSSAGAGPFNTSTLTDYNRQLNLYANLRDYLTTFTTNLAVINSNSIKLQASSLSQLTEATNQVTRTAAMSASEKCYQLAQALQSMATKISYEDVQVAVSDIIQCTSNVLTAIHGPLQARTPTLDLDFSRANAFPDDYDTDLESEWSNLRLFAAGDDFSFAAIQQGRNLYYQKQAARKISEQTEETLSLLTSTVNTHLNIGQNLTINTSSVFMSLETISIGSLSNKTIQQVGRSRIQLPPVFRDNKTISLRSVMQPLAVSGQTQSHTNLSTLISLSILDEYDNEVSIPTTLAQPYQFTIPRDPNVIIPLMTPQNVTAFNSAPHRLLFNLHYINIGQTNNLTVSVHAEIQPLNTILAYLLIYKFDESPRLNSSINQIDGWSLLCPFHLGTDNIYTHFIDNRMTKDHQSIIYGLRQLNATEMSAYCSNQSNNMRPPTTDQPFTFTSNYRLRVYTSGCYYLDSNNQWQSDGLVVGPLTNHNETQCFSTHLSTFSGGFRVLPVPIHWHYVYAPNTDCFRIATVHMTIVGLLSLYLLLSAYARCHNKENTNEVTD